MLVLIWIVISVGIYCCGNLDLDGQPQVKHKESEKRTDEMVHEVQNTPEFNEEIRVLICNSNYAGVHHQDLILSSDAGLVCKVGQQYYECTPQQKIRLTAKQLQDKEATIWTKQDGQIRLENVARNENVQYRGRMECYGTKEGIILVNELPVEEYLYGVVPSEMPSSYPLEALKAQAIGARTYAYYHKQSYAYPEWMAHVDDSTTYQVYKNISETEETRKAIDATKGQVMTCNGKLIESFYYATSSGYGSGYEVWGTNEQKEYLATKALNFPKSVVQASVSTKTISLTDEKSYRSFIDHGNDTDVEYKEAWYRWKYDTSVNGQKLLQKLYNMALAQPEVITITALQENKMEDLLMEKILMEKILMETGIKKIQITERLQSGLANQITIETENYIVRVNTQYTIRQLFANQGESVERQDGTEYMLGELLPSAYFYIDCFYDNSEKDSNEVSYVSEISIHGGGFGHGAGMSQNGAKCLAQKGYMVQDILQYYYQNTEIVSVSEFGGKL